MIAVTMILMMIAVTMILTMITVTMILMIITVTMIMMMITATMMMMIITVTMILMMITATVMKMMTMMPRPDLMVPSFHATAEAISHISLSLRFHHQKNTFFFFSNFNTCEDDAFGPILTL